MEPPACPYCGSPSVKTLGKDLWPGRSDLAGARFYVCQPCEAWVGCHPGTSTPLGRLANKELRRAKQAAHAEFDPLWKEKIARGETKKKARSAARQWLAGQLQIPFDDCHIDMFDTAMCERVVEICRPYRTRLRENLARQYQEFA
jgi:zinc-finger-containing domain